MIEYNLFLEQAIITSSLLETKEYMEFPSHLVVSQLNIWDFRKLYMLYQHRFRGTSYKSNLDTAMINYL